MTIFTPTRRTDRPINNEIDKHLDILHFTKMQHNQWGHKVNSMILNCDEDNDGDDDVAIRLLMMLHSEYFPNGFEL